MARFTTSTFIVTSQNEQLFWKWLNKSKSKYIIGLPFIALLLSELPANTLTISREVMVVYDNYNSV
jgi:hypothetical protein